MLMMSNRAGPLGVMSNNHAVGSLHMPQTRGLTAIDTIKTPELFSGQTGTLKTPDIINILNATQEQNPLEQQPTEYQRSNLSIVEPAPKAAEEQQPVVPRKPIVKKKKAGRIPELLGENENKPYEELSEKEKKIIKRRERNKVAALRCRQKKQKWFAQMQQDLEQTKEQNQILHMERERLIATIADLEQRLSRYEGAMQQQ
eukprot:Clim_evm42s11 gene=Clim_evmTU42s11